jgi:hypothetical protein
MGVEVGEVAWNEPPRVDLPSNVAANDTAVRINEPRLEKVLIDRDYRLTHDRFLVFSMK